MKKECAAGFTLLELLITIVVTVVLAGLLLPALAKAKSRAGQTSCASSLRQLGLAVPLFAFDNDDSLPRENGGNGVNSWDTVRAFTNQNVWYNVLLLAMNKKPASFYADTTFPELQRQFYNASALFSCSVSKVDPVLAIDDPRFSRSMNSRLMVGNPQPRLGQLTAPSRTPLLLEAGVPNEKPLPSQLTYDGRPHVKWERGSARHNGGGNAVFGDGRVSLIPAREITNQFPKTFQWDK